MEPVAPVLGVKTAIRGPGRFENRPFLVRSLCRDRHTPALGRRPLLHRRISNVIDLSLRLRRIEDDAGVGGEFFVVAEGRVRTCDAAIGESGRVHRVARQEIVFATDCLVAVFDFSLRGPDGEIVGDIYGLEGQAQDVQRFGVEDDLAFDCPIGSFCLQESRDPSHKRGVTAINGERKNGGRAAVHRLPAIPSEVGLRFGVEDAVQIGTEIAERGVSSYFADWFAGGFAVDGDYVIVLLLFEVAELDGQGVGKFPLRRLIFFCNFGRIAAGFLSAYEVGEGVTVVERFLPGLFNHDSAISFGWRRRLCL